MSSELQGRRPATASLRVMLPGWPATVQAVQRRTAWPHGVAPAAPRSLR